MIKRTIRLIPFITMPIVYIYAMEAGLHDVDGVLLDFAVNLSWLPIAICILYLTAFQKKDVFLVEIGVVLHIIFACFVFSTYYISITSFIILYGFISKRLMYRVNSFILLCCIILVFIVLIQCRKDIVKQRNRP